MFKPYMHIEKFGNDDVRGIELGECYVFPKLDGTNASLWALEVNGELLIRGGSRTRELSMASDNAGFFNRSRIDERYAAFFVAFPHLRLYGEWLVPHTLKTYREDAWGKFWVFDVYNDSSQEYVPYDGYKEFLDEYNIDYIPPLAKIKNGSYENFVHLLQGNNFYIKDGMGVGEGIVIKNYDFYNRYNKQVWAKVITSEFKEKHHKEMGCPETEKQLVEENIAEDYVTQALCTKTKAKIEIEYGGGWTSKYIPRLLETVFHDIVREDTWDIVKNNKNVTINFGTLRHFVYKKVKEQLPEVF
jgi:hypothetical protein